MNNTQTEKTPPLTTSDDQIRVIYHRAEQLVKAEKKLLDAFDESVGLNCTMCQYCRVKIDRSSKRGFTGVCVADPQHTLDVDMVHKEVCRDFHYIGGGAHDMRLRAMLSFSKKKFMLEYSGRVK